MKSPEVSKECICSRKKRREDSKKETLIGGVRYNVCAVRIACSRTLPMRVSFFSNRHGVSCGNRRILSTLIGGVRHRVSAVRIVSIRTPPQYGHSQGNVHGKALC